MTPTDRTLARALVGIFSQFKIYPGGRLMMRDLNLHWRQTGLRAEDLDRAIGVASRYGLLREQYTDWGPAVEILRTRLPRHIQGDNPLERALAAATDALRLFRLKRRRRRPLRSGATSRPAGH